MRREIAFIFGGFMKYTTILLDLDGTIFDFHAAQRQAFFETFAHFGIDADEAMLCRYDIFNDSLWQMLEHGEITRDQLFKNRFKLFFEKEGINISVSPADVQKRYMQALIYSSCPPRASLAVLHR